MIDTKKSFIKCMAKNCQVKIVTQFKKVIIDKKEQLESKEILNFCPKHQDQFKNKLKEIKNHFTKIELQTKFANDIATNIVKTFTKKNNPN